MCGKLRMHGIDISFDDMDNDYGNAVITRAHFADYLMKHGYVSSKKEAFDRYVGDNAPCFVPRRYLSSGDGIRIKLDAKGVPAWNVYIQHIQWEKRSRCAGLLRNSD